ncbi:Metallo-hydrolase/oxidoreductase [Thozetella sp. PMI_491]|nr:Metallo-hydrolase/oxidoreductase [Thozetella sp. PMI_491]
MAPSFPFSITHIGTATAIFHFDGVNILTDPVFSPAGTEWDLGIVVLRQTGQPKLGLADLPPIDAVLVSHEDHADNLDEPGRQILYGRHVLTTPDGASKLAPRPGVKGLQPWETVTLRLGGRDFAITGTPCVHLPGGEVTGFILSAEEFGTTDGLPNVVYFSGDTIYLPELAQIAKKYHVTAAVLNIGKVMVALPPDNEPLQITMDGAEAAQLFRDLKADVLVPMHYESWEHFTQKGDELKKALETAGVSDKVIWLKPGEKTKIF